MLTPCIEIIRNVITVTTVTTRMTIPIKARLDFMLMNNNTVGLLFEGDDFGNDSGQGIAEILGIPRTGVLDADLGAAKCSTFARLFLNGRSTRCHLSLLGPVFNHSFLLRNPKRYAKLILRSPELPKVYLRQDALQASCSSSIGGRPVSFNLWFP